MKIKDHRQMMRSLTDPLNIPKLKQQLADNPVLTKEEFEARMLLQHLPWYETIPAFVLPEFDELSPKEQQYYHQGPFSTHEDFRGAKGGTVPQLVQPGPGRPGYGDWRKKPSEIKLKRKIKEANEMGKVYDKKTKRIRAPRPHGTLAKSNIGPTAKGAGVQMTKKEAAKIIETLPENMYLMKTPSGWEYSLRFTKKKGGETKVYTRRASPENLEFLLNKQEELIKQYHSKRLTNEKYEQMRLLDENKILTQDEFLKKLKGFETSMGNKWTIGAVQHAERTLELAEFLERETTPRTLSEATEIIKNRSLTGQAELTDIYKRLPGAQNKKARLSAIRKLATRIVAREAEMSAKGRFYPDKSREGYLWNNFYESIHRGTKMKMEGTFDGKSLKFRKNWPRNAKGIIDWSMKDPQTGEAAWKGAKFTDTQTPKGQVTYTFDNLATQVDDAYGKGFFTRSTSPYVAQKELWGKTYKGEPIGKYVARENIIKEYQAKPGNAGKMPSKKYIADRISYYTPAQVHHFGERGVKGDPYRTQLTSRTANMKINAAEGTYNKKLRLAGKDPAKIADAKKWFKNEIQNISKEHGGIKYTVDGKVIGGKTTPVSVYSTELKKLVKNDKAAIKILKQAGFRCKQSVGGTETVACYLKDARNQLKSVKNREPGMGRKLARFRNFGKKALLLGLGPADIVFEGLFAQHGIASGHGKDQIWADSILGMVIPQSLGGPKWSDEIRLEKISELGGKEYVDALKQEQEFNNILDQYHDVGKIPDKVRGYDASNYKQKLYNNLDKVTDEYIARQEYLTVPENARPTDLDAEGNPLQPVNLGPGTQIMKWSQDLNPDSFAAQDFRTANEKLQAMEAAKGQASGVPPVRLETQEAERIRKTRDIGEHPRGEDYWVEFFRDLRGWDPAWSGPYGTGYSFKHEGMDYYKEGGRVSYLDGGIVSLLKK